MEAANMGMRRWIEANRIRKDLRQQEREFLKTREVLTEKRLELSRLQGKILIGASKADEHEVLKPTLARNWEKAERQISELDDQLHRIDQSLEEIKTQIEQTKQPSLFQKLSQMRDGRQTK